MQWDKLKTFYFVAKYLSFTKTGQELNISQSAISRQIIDLEYQVGHKLFKRLPRGLALTQQGELLFKNVEKMYLHSIAALSQIEDEYQEPQGNLKLGANVGLVNNWICDLLPDFLKTYPKINLSILAKDMSLDVEALEVDVALQPFMPEQAELVQNHLMTWNRRLYASKEYIAEFGMPKNANDLKNHRVIGYGAERIYLFDDINWHLRLSGKKGEVLQPYASANSWRIIFKLGCSGIGIIPLAQEFPALEGSNLVEVLPEIQGSPVEIYFTYPIQLKGVKKIVVLENYLRDHIGKHHRKYQPPSIK